MPIVTNAEPTDVPAIADILEEMDRFYGDTDFKPKVKRIEEIAAIVFRDCPAVHLLLAREGERIVGLATYSFLWPAVGITHSLYLKELYVVQEYRRMGVGKLLMAKACEVAAEQGCSRVDWATDRDNLDAQRFYDELGFAPLSAKILYRLQVDGVNRSFSSS